MLFALFLFPACNSEKGSNVDIALTDGTHVAGQLVAVDTDWLVLDQRAGSHELPLTLLDYSLVDTVRISGQKYAPAGALLGGLVGALGGALVASGFDSTKAATEHTRVWLGVGAGLLAGAAAGYIVGGMIEDSDIVFPQPSPEDYSDIRVYARYPDTLPSALRAAIDSEAAAEQ